MFGQQPKITREFYDAIMEFTDFDHTAPADELTRDQDLSRYGWCKVHGGGFRPYGHCDRERLVQVGICEDCDFAMGLLQMKDDPETARIAGKHWRVGVELTTDLDPNKSLADIVDDFKKANPSKWGKGCGGAISVIRFSDGRTVVTNDLWGQGDVPELVAHLLPDNAEFVEV